MAKTWEKLKANPQLFRRYFLREKILILIREFFASRGFHEVEAPLLAPALPAESYLEVFETNLLDRKRNTYRSFLTASPEMFLKKLLVAGIGNCFSLCKSFRNHELSNLHNPEFTMLEWYRVNADYQDLMIDTENLFIFIAENLNKSINLIYQNKKIDLTRPWEKLTMTEAFNKYAKLDLTKILTLQLITDVAKARGYSVSQKNTWEEIFHQIYLNEVEAHFGQGKPTIIYDFPAQMAALAKKKANDPRFAERFEVFVAGLELGDAYSELTDWKEQEDRFKNESKERMRLGKIDYPYDRDFIAALKSGLPKCAGLALGVDRLIMLFANTATIDEILFFPAKEMWKQRDT